VGASESRSPQVRDRDSVGPTARDGAGGSRAQARGVMRPRASPGPNGSRTQRDRSIRSRSSSATERCSEARVGFIDGCIPGAARPDQAVPLRDQLGLLSPDLRVDRSPTALRGPGRPLRPGRTAGARAADRRGAESRPFCGARTGRRPRCSLAPEGRQPDTPGWAVRVVPNVRTPAAGVVVRHCTDSIAELSPEQLELVPRRGTCWPVACSRQRAPTIFACVARPRRGLESAPLARSSSG
jgi:hypothetical protein